ncbi:MAG: hypothetical protein AAGE52_33175 [Myxococcota bacterium]
MTAQRIARRRKAAWAALGLLAINFIATASLDHGYNWDEWYHLEGTRQTVDQLQLHPRGHIYNGAYFLPGYVVLAAHLVDDLPAILGEMAKSPGVEFDLSRYPTLAEWRTDMLRLLSTERYKQEVRFVFVLMTVPALLWVFLTVLALFPHRYWEALGAAALVGLSWEISRRSRCIEVDAPQMQFVAFELFMIASAFSAKLRSRALWNVVGIGFAAGLIVACKASGVYALILGGAAVFAVPLFRGVRDRALLLTVLTLGFVVAVFLASPFTAVDPIRAVWQQMATWADYQSIRDTHPFFVNAPWEHLGKVLLWLFLVVTAPRFYVAAVFALVCVLGMGVLARYRPRFAIIAALYPLATLSTMTALILLQIRNYTQFFPFLAISFGAGLVYLGRRFADRPIALRGLIAVIGAAFAFNAGWLALADQSVRTTTRDSILADVRAHVSGIDHDLRVSPRLHRALEATFDEHFECTARSRPGDDLREPRVLMYYTDHHPFHWTAMSPGYVERTFAPMDANFDWYSLWKGRLEHHRVVLMSLANADEMGVPMHSFFDCKGGR